MDFLDTLSTQFIPQARQWMPETPWTPQANVMLGAMGLQESDGQDIRQVGGGPGMGYWQEEAGIGLVLTNRSSAALARRCVELSGILAGQNPGMFSPDGTVEGQAGGGYPSTTVPLIVAGMRRNFLNFPTLQLCFARLMLWDNPNPLPALGDCNGAWNYYDATWRPGSPRQEKWAACYAASLQHFTGSAPAPTGGT